MAVEIEPLRPRAIRWRLYVLTTLVATLAFFVIPRFFLQPDLEPIGPTDKLRFLRGMDHSAYRRGGQKAFHVEGETLIVVWDLRWNALPEGKQQEIVRATGKAWHIVGGNDTRFQIDGEDGFVASYP